MKALRTLVAVIGMLLGLTLGAAAQSNQGRPLIILIHGRGLGGLYADSVRAAWLKVFREGQARIGFTSIHDDDVRLAWYGNASMHMYCMPSGEMNADRRSLLQRIADIIGRMPSVERAIGNRVFEDTQEYFRDPCYRAQVDEALREELEKAKIEKRPIVLVAHSMGSMVSFGVLTNHWVPTEDDSVAFISLGSMLGMEQIPKALLGAYVESPVPVPPVITHWTNVRNDGDLLSFPTSGRFRSKVPARIPVDVLINAAGGSRHSAETYFRNPTFAKVVASDWCSAFAKIVERPSQCANLRPTP